MKTEIITCLSDLVRSRAFASYEESKLGNELFISDPERADRIHSAAENGADGSTHAEHLDDQRECNRDMLNDYRAQFMAQGYPKFLADNLAEQLRDYIEEEIDDCEQWHEKNGSLHAEVG